MQHRRKKKSSKRPVTAPTRPEASNAATNASPQDRSHGVRRLLYNADLIAAAAIACLFTAHFWTTPDPFTGSGTDIVSLETPLHALAGKWLSSGVLPLWNPYIFGGIPFQAGVHGLLYPGFLGAAFLDVFWDIKIFIALHLMLAAVGGAWFARTDCRSPISRVLLGTVTAVSAFTVLHLFAGHRVLVACTAYLPWVAGAARRIVRGERAAIVYGIALAGLMMLVGHYQIIFIAGWGLLLWMVLDRVLNRESADGVSALRSAGSAAATIIGLFVAGALIAAVQLLPAAFLAGESQRPGDNAAFAASFSASPSALLCYLMPDFYGNKIETPFVGDFSFWESVNYLGIIPLLLIALAPAVLPLRRVVPGIIVIGLALVVSMGAHTPLFDIYLHIPGADLFRAPGRTALLVTFFGAHLAASTLDAMIMTSGSQKPALTRIVSKILRTPEIATSRIIFVAAIFLVLLTATDLYHYGRRFLDTGPAEKFSFPQKIENALRENSAPGMRMIAPTNGRMMNHAGLFNLGTPAGYDIFIERRYAEFLNRSQGRSPDRFISMERLRLGTRLARRMGASLLLSTLPPRNGRTVRAHGHPGFDLVTAAEGLYLYRDPSPEPRVALVHKTEAIADKETLFRRLASPAFDIGRVALLDAPLPESFPEPEPRTEGNERAEIAHYSPNRVEIAVDAKSAAVLVLSDSLMFGWRAEIDGRLVPMVHANWVMRAVPVPKGNSTVVMTYLPRPFTIGAAVSLLSVLLLLGFTITERRRRGGRRPPADPS